MIQPRQGAGSALAKLIAAQKQVLRSGNWPRAVVTKQTWVKAIARLANGDWDMLGLWGEPGWVHLALLDRPDAVLGILSLHCSDGHFPPSRRRTRRRSAPSAPSMISSASSPTTCRITDPGSTTANGA